MATVTEMFGPNAAKYATSPVHNNPTELAGLIALVNPNGNELLLDVATGAGNVALAFAPHVKQVVAFDITPSMLEQVTKRASEMGLTNVSTLEGDATSIPSHGNTYDVVALRLAAHHFPSLSKFMSEVERVLKPGGKFLLVDTAVPEDDTLDRKINHLEVLRDPSHVKSYKYSEWRASVEEAGMEILSEEHRNDFQDSKEERGMDYDVWIERINTPQENRAELKQIFLDASPDLVEALLIEYKGERILFSLPRTIILARKML